jgi:hypothetical protein
MSSSGQAYVDEEDENIHIEVYDGADDEEEEEENSN